MADNRVVGRARAWRERSQYGVIFVERKKDPGQDSRRGPGYDFRDENNHSQNPILRTARRVEADADGDASWEETVL